MAVKKEQKPSIPQTTKDLSCCRVESMVTVDERGQMVLPKEIRAKAGINPGDKLALISWENEGKISCISLIKTDDLTSMVKTMLGPMMKDIIQS